MPKEVRFAEDTLTSFSDNPKNTSTKNEALKMMPVLPQGSTASLHEVLAFLDESDRLINDQHNTTVHWLMNFFLAHQEQTPQLLRDFLEQPDSQIKEDFFVLLLEKNQALLGALTELIQADAALKTLLDSALQTSTVYQKTLAEEERRQRDLKAMQEAEHLEADADTVSKTALVDVDGCLVQDGKLNMALVERLKSQGYEDIILFTQRSKFMVNYRLASGENHDGLFFTPDIVQALQAQGLTVRVSTSIDHCVGQPLERYAQLAQFEMAYQQAMQQLKDIPDERRPYEPIMLPLYEEILMELQALANYLSDYDLAQMAQQTIATTPAARLKQQADQGVSIDQLVRNETRRLIAKRDEIVATDVSQLVSQGVDEVTMTLNNWGEFHPQDKVAQKQNLNTELNSRADYYDDSLENITEIAASETAGNTQSFVVHQQFMIPLEIFQQKLAPILQVNSKDDRKPILTRALQLEEGSPFTGLDIAHYVRDPNPQVQAFGQQCYDALIKRTVDLLTELPEGFTVSRTKTSMGSVFRSFQPQSNDKHYHDKLIQATELLNQTGQLLPSIRYLQAQQDAVNTKVLQQLMRSLSPDQLMDNEFVTSLTQSVCQVLDQTLISFFQTTVLDAYKSKPPSIDMAKLNENFEQKCKTWLASPAISQAVSQAIQSPPVAATQQAVKLNAAIELLDVIVNPTLQIEPAIAPVSIRSETAFMDLKKHLQDEFEVRFAVRACDEALMQKFESLSFRELDEDSDDATRHATLKELLAAHFDPQKMVIVNELKVHQDTLVDHLRDEHLEHIEHLFDASHALVSALEEHHRDLLHELLPPSKGVIKTMATVGEPQTLLGHLASKEALHAELAAKITLFVAGHKA